MRSLRNIIGTGLAGLAIVATMAGGSPAYGAPEAAAQKAPQAACSAVWAMNTDCHDTSTYARLGTLTPAEAGSLGYIAPAQVAIGPSHYDSLGNLTPAQAASLGFITRDPTLGRVQRAVVTGTEERFFHPDPQTTRVWVNGGLTQIRDLGLTGTSTFSGAGVTLTGPEIQLTNARLDDTANGYTWGVVTYKDTATGLTCTGSVRGNITNGLGSLEVVAPCSDGALLKGNLRDISTDPPGKAPPDSVKSSFSGVLYGPLSVENLNPAQVGTSKTANGTCVNQNGQNC
jgi:hypothetical protein